MTFIFGHANVHAPGTTADRHSVIMAMAARADLISFNEANKDGAYIKALKGFGSHVVGENALAWRAEKFDLLESGYRTIMLGGLHGTGAKGDKRRRGPNRTIVWAVLREKASGREVIAFSTHLIAKAFTDNKWRKPLWTASVSLARGELSRVWQKYRTADVIGAGDLNSPGYANFGGRMSPVNTPPTFGSRKYDQIHIGQGDPA